jgi:peptide-methionine (R)-S-oxide reductase
MLMTRLNGSLGVAILLAGFVAAGGWFVASSVRDAGVQANAAEPAAPTAKPSASRTAASDGKVVKTEAEWKKILTQKEYYVLRQKGTERAFTGQYTDTKTPGVYRCAGCGEVLFTSDGKFDSHCGWPSFYQPDGGLKSKKITEHVDNTLGMQRIEVTCTKCGGHLGHVFNDGVGTPTGMRYCINSVSIKLDPKKDGAKPDAAKPESSEKK